MFWYEVILALEGIMVSELYLFNLKILNLLSGRSPKEKDWRKKLTKTDKVAQSKNFINIMLSGGRYGQGSTRRQ